ncbi:hypothetical protein Glove_29g182 [Diversispora epigaea]|uniref:Cyclin N-terminal domain-containing protein n=1 Tax=Diversispora epigaea TaxID=1348612 RepID=A0A397JTX7_9GLOM|nr:hypothetical protein Glove_29g182 [Diversispora epigaea]
MQKTTFSSSSRDVHLFHQARSCRRTKDGDIKRLTNSRDIYMCIYVYRKVMILKFPNSELVLISLKYVQRYIKNGINSNITNEYQLFTIALMLANKWHNDEAYSNKVWSETSNISRIDIDAMEISFLKSLDFKMHITKEKYAFWLICLKKFNLTDKYEYLFAKKVKKTTTSQQNSPKLGFNYDAKIIQAPVGFERNVVAFNYVKEYKLFE